MLAASVKIESEFGRVADAADKAAFENVRHAAAGIRKTAEDSVKVSPEPSTPGQPPHSRDRSGRSLKRSFRFDATDNEAIVGPVASQIGEVAAAHEFGESFRGVKFPERPVMEPALTSNIDRFAGSFAGSIG